MAITIPFFTPSSNDQSLYYLGQIFGRMDPILTPDTAPMIFGKMFNTLNTIILTIGVLIVVYVTIVGVIKTAHEGEALGKQWSTLWLPLRMVLGIAALIPSTSGYSFLQIAIMWVIVQGIGAADSIWQTTLQYYDKFGSLTAKVSTTAGITAATNLETLFKMMVCQATAGKSDSNYFIPGTDSSTPTGMGNYWAYQQAGASIGKSESLGTLSVTQFGPGDMGACGSMTYCNKTFACNDTSTSGQIACAACTAQDDALGKIMQSDQTINETVTEGGTTKTYTFMGFKKVAQLFMETDLAYRQFYDASFGTAGTAMSPEANQYCSDKGIPTTVDPAATGTINLCCGKPPVPSFFTSSSPPIVNCSLKNNGLTSGDANGPPKGTVISVYWPYLVNQNPDLNASFIQTAADYYSAAISAAVEEKQKTMPQTAGDQAAVQEAINNGWLYAGAFYYSLSKYNNKNQSGATPTFQVAGSDPATALSTTSNPLYGYRNNYTAAGYLVDYISQQVRTSTAGGTAAGGTGTTITPGSTSFPSEVSGLSAITDKFWGFGSWALNTFMEMFTGSQAGATNPLVSVQSFGQSMLIAIQVIFAAVLVIMVTLGLLGYVGGSFLGTTVSNPVGPVLTLLSIIFTPLFSAFLGGLFVFAALLAIYTPLIPFIIFTIGALAWFILVIEAVIAGPLVALGLLIPGGQSELFGRAENAFMLLFSIFLRPGLMVFGLVAAMLLSIVAVSIVNIAFNAVAGAALSDPGPVEVLLFIAAYASLILVVLNKSFTLIHMVPDQVLRWIGHHAGQEGAPGDMLGEVKGGVSGAGAGVKGAGADMRGRASSNPDFNEAAKKRQAKKNGSPTVSDADKNKK